MNQCAMGAMIAMPFGTAHTEADHLTVPQPPPSIPRNEQRPHPRAELTLPVRLRWLGPFGLETEITQTCNVSRSGLLVVSDRPHFAGSHVWVTAPFSANSAPAEPETPARVARCQVEQGGKQLIGIAFDSRKLSAGLAAKQTIHGADLLPGSTKRKFYEIGDRRRGVRTALALFIGVSRCSKTGKLELPTHEDAPWPEQTMTMNISRGGILFCSLRIHEVGERLNIRFPKGGPFPDGERPGRIVHQAPLDAESPLLCVGVEFFPSEQRKQ